MLVSSTLVKVKSLCRVRLCNPMDCSPPGSSVHGIFQARVLEWVPFPSPGDLADPAIEPGSPPLQADALLSEPPGKPSSALDKCKMKYLSYQNRLSEVLLLK